jgi:hypothetical protein
VGGLTVATIARTTLSGLSRRPSAAGVWVVVALGGAGIGLLAASVPVVVQAVLGAVVLSVPVCRTVLRRARAQRDRPFLGPLVQWGLVLRALYVVTHLVVALWFYGGMTDLRTYMEYVTENHEQILAGTLTREAFATQGGQSVGNGITVAILVAIAMITGPTLWALFVVSAAVSLASAYLFLRAFQRLYPSAEGERFLAITLFLLPAIGFWSTFAGKDFISLFLIAWASYAAAGLLTRINAADVLALTVSGGIFILQRAQIAIPVMVGIAVALGVQQFRRREIPLVFKAAIVVAIAYAVSSASVEGLVAFGFKEVSVDAVAERIETVHRGFANTPGATALPPALEDRSLGSILSFIPLGVFTLLFRPFLWEAHNALALAAGLENLLLVALIVWRRRQLGRSLSSLLKEPFLLYCTLALLGAAAAMSFSWNLGTMARHKTMVVPYLMILLAGTRAAVGGPQGERTISA